MLDVDNIPESGADGVEDTTPAERPRRRRAASRPAGPPPAVEFTAPVPVTEAAGTASVQTTGGDAAVVTSETEQAPARPTRRRATRKAGTPKPVEAATQQATSPEPEAQQTDSQQTEAQQTTGAEAAADVSRLAQPVTSDAATEEEKPARARRSRSRKKTEPADQVTEQGDAEHRTDQAQPGADESATERGADVDAALAAVSAAAADRPRSRRRVAKAVANPFVSPTLPVDENGEVDAQAVLSSLAASIAQEGAEQEQPAQSEPQAADATAEQGPHADAAHQDEADDDQDPGDDSAADGADSEPGEDSQGGESDEDNDDSEDSDSEESDSDDEDSTPTTRRRRRRRGGRRRRRSADDEGDSDDAQDQDGSDPGDDQSDDDSAEDDSSEDNDSAGESGRRRRRRRRRRGEDTGSADDDPSDVVVRVREPRRIRTSAQANEEVTGIDGSTRMEAKKQRRREGRAAGRRRAPILSEAEFLARRESVDRRMVIRQNDEYTQLAVLEDDILVEHYVDRASATSLIGNIYLGRVQNVLPSMEAAFIDIGRGRNAVLYAGEIDWEHFGAHGEQKKVENVLKSGQTVLVQVSKDPVGAKGARLTSHISLPGRYVVYSPGGHLSGISRKLADSERHRLKDILGDLIDDKSSVIVRTAAEGASEDELVRDVNRLKAQWEIIEKKSKQGSAPQQLYAEPDLTVRIVRDLFTEDFSELVVSGNGGSEDAYEAINGYVTHVAPHLAERLTRWDSQSQGDPFAKHRIDDQIAKALERKVFLPSGGSLVIDRTEAMTVIDVNTGKFTGAGGNLEATVTSNNLEAAEEVVRQLRLRDIGGIIVVDFIDMVLPSNRELLLRRLVECLGRDRTRHQVAEVTSLGLVQMTRKKIGTGLAEAFTEECGHCGGRGYTRHDHPVETQAPADGGDRHHGGGGRRGRKH